MRIRGTPVATALAVLFGSAVLGVMSSGTASVATTPVAPARFPVENS
ncbi:hypothetical protein [Streptomyces phaeoluteigriseus]|nr:hypothetical protein [Streptomyces phaeoluteigriseus]